jgi:hypothetical protein
VREAQASIGSGIGNPFFEPVRGAEASKRRPAIIVCNQAATSAAFAAGTVS